MRLREQAQAIDRADGAPALRPQAARAVDRPTRRSVAEAAAAAAWLPTVNPAAAYYLHKQNQEEAGPRETEQLAEG